ERSPLIHGTWRAIISFLELYRNVEKDAKSRTQELTRFLNSCSAKISVGRSCLTGPVRGNSTRPARTTLGTGASHPRDRWVLLSRQQSTVYLANGATAATDSSGFAIATAADQRGLNIEFHPHIHITFISMPPASSPSPSRALHRPPLDLLCYWIIAPAFGRCDSFMHNQEQVQPIAAGTYAAAISAQRQSERTRVAKGLFLQLLDPPAIADEMPSDVIRGFSSTKELGSLQLFPPREE
ncbi:hypothetical protein E4U38_000414, partial [Claviceps purpurea]